jgi:putative transposase
VIMPEHLHLLLRPTTDVPLWKMLESVKKSASSAILDHMVASGDSLLERIKRLDSRRRVWQKGGGFDRNVRSDREMQREIAYIHSNPVKRGLVKHPCDWTCSSARWWVARYKGASQDPADVSCEWPPGDPRGWAMWRGFLKRPPDERGDA